ncbi:BZ3500_MvSof-1268-A1-R1_Chr7-1g09388 [Microbotryum saponariae]|uniref:BZ3500_MvSof-1268-A1-R1_Chr7-1g09388 protein n=1 Tax=Microbotryum saponariae TaxID=289078 RepID=A0A2X0KY51_9BASI|nr:BZ3501_MvSof-1269-A2-R1_Chr7-1g09093 [Microbotryum saponariae]SDA03344.1 BZ3500_MvSof-1268-A1-R1_Chr7-1g09388 [Microbotryum saponariae]
MSLPPTRLFTPSCPKTSPPSNRPTLPDSPDQRRVSRHRCSDQRTQEWISTFGRRVDKQYGALAQRYRHFGSLDGVELRLIEQACYSTHLIDGTMPFRMIDGRQVIESLGPPTTTYCPTKDLTSCYPDERIISTEPASKARKALLIPGATRDTSRSDAHRSAPQATFDRPPRARKRSERVFEDF